MTKHPILKEIKSGKIPPVYLFFGPEEFLIEDTLNQTIDILVDPSSKDFNLNIYHAESSTPTEVLDTVRTLPFMSDRRLVVLKRVDDTRQSFMDSQSLLGYLSSPYKETCLIFTAREIDKRRKFYNLISKSGKAVYFSKPKSNQVVRWIIERAKEEGYQVEPSAAKYIVDVFNSNLKRIDNELEKIFLYSGKDKCINLNTVQLVAGNPKVDSIFVLTGAIGEKDLVGSLGRLENLLAHGALPLPTLGMITRQFRLIWQTMALTEKGASQTNISREIGIPPYFIGEIISQSRKFTKKSLTRVFKRLLQTDLELKSSGRSPGLTMESLVIDLCK